MKYDYGETVLASIAEPTGNREVVAEIVGVTEIVTPEQSVALGHAVGTTMYTVEFPDGTDALLPEDRLKEYQE